MAKDITGNPWVFDGIDQYEGFANTGEATAPNFDNKFYVRFIRVESGAAGGAYDIRESNGGARLAYENVAANTEVEVLIDQYVNGVYTEAFGDGRVLVFHGQDN